jgi:c-di-GMP-binding flagellar brake protein YcgR
MNDLNLDAEITKVAFELYERSGKVKGRDLENWLEAEKLVTSRYDRQERRKYARRPFVQVIRYSPYQHRLKKSTDITCEGVTVDISERGLGMVTDFPLKKGDILLFEPEMKVINDSKTMVSTVMCAREIEKDIYRVGLKIFIR